MTDPRPMEGDPLVRMFLRESSPPAEAPEVGSCPDALVLARMAEGRLFAADRDGVERHLVGCESCRAVVTSLVRETTAAPGLRAVRPRRLVWKLAAAALAASVLLLLGRAWKQEAPVTTDASLEEATARLRRAHPDVFGDFRPLSATERRSPPSPLLRGGPRLVAPGATVVDPRPSFRWEPLAGVTAWTVTLRTADGTTVWSETAAGSPHPFPPGERDLPRGSAYLWELRAQGPLGETSEQRGFGVADETALRAFTEAKARIAEASPSALRPLLLAQFAFRRGLYDEAERAVREFLAYSPTDDVGRETAYAILRAQGSSEAAAFEPKGVGR